MSYQPYVDPVGMDPRHYGFVDSVKRAFSQYAKFDGVASVAEYWWFVLFNAILGGLTPFLVVFCISWQLSWLLGLRQAAVTRRLPEFRAESCC